MGDPSSQLIGPILSIIILTFVNAFLAGAEMAFVSLNPSKMKQMAEDGDKKAIRVLKLLEDSDEFLSAIQVGITLAGFLNSASAAQNFVGFLSPLFTGIPGGQTIATVLVTLMLSYVTLVLGELYPKQLALQLPESYARLSAGTILIIKRIFKPFIWLLTISTGLLRRITPISFTANDQKITRDEMKVLLKNSINEGIIDTHEFHMMRGVLSLDTKTVREVMIPRVDAFMIDIEDDPQESIKKMIEQSYARIPVYKGDRDQVIGLLTLKEVLIHLEALKNNEISLSDLLREGLFVSEATYIDNLLLKFKSSKQLLAIVVDEFGGVSGLVTLEDLIEEIVGDIDDEYDKVINDYTFMIRASMPISSFNEYFHTSIESSEYETMAGYVLEQFGYIPEPKSQLEIKDYQLIVDSVKGNRIQTIKVIKKVNEQVEES